MVPNVATGNEGAALHVRLLGVPVRVEASFAVVAVLFGLNLGSATRIATWAAVVTVSVLVHELGHASAMRLAGVRSRIVLHAMGGATIPATAIGSRRARIAVDLAGPFAGLFLLGVPAVWLQRTWMPPSTEWDLVVVLAVWVNVVWSLVNLLPVLPLDGGNVTRELLDAATGEHGEVPTRVLSMVVAGAAGLYALSTGWVFGAMFAVFFVAMNWRPLAERRNREVAGDVRSAYRALALGDADQALALAWAAVPRARPADLRALAVEIAAWAQVARGDDTQARLALARMPSGHEATGHLQCILTDVEPAERVNLTVDAWLADDLFVPPPVYVPRMAAADLLEPVIDRLLATRAVTAPRARKAVQQLLGAAGRLDEASRFGPPVDEPEAT